MPRTVFLAGAAGAVGRRLMPLLVQAGHHVVGTTRSKEKAEGLRKLGVAPVIVDVFDMAALKDAMQIAAPYVVIHQLTDLSLISDPARRNEALDRNARLRIQGTANLVAGALLAGARRMIAQSISFVYAAGPEPHSESDPLNHADPQRARTVEAVAALEREVTQTPGIEGIVLRYGHFYGPGTGRERAEAPSKGALHVDAAAQAALLAIERGRAGIYNIAEDDGDVTINKARAEFGFDPGYRLLI